MHYYIATIGGAVEGREVADIGGKRLNSLRPLTGVLVGAPRKQTYLVSLLQQLRDHSCANDTCPARDQNFHYRHLHVVCWITDFVNVVFPQA